MIVHYIAKEPTFYEMKLLKTKSMSSAQHCSWLGTSFFTKYHYQIRSDKSLFDLAFFDNFRSIQLQHILQRFKTDKNQNKFKKNDRNKNIELRCCLTRKLFEYKILFNCIYYIKYVVIVSSSNVNTRILICKMSLNVHNVLVKNRIFN